MKQETVFNLRLSKLDRTQLLSWIWAQAEQPFEYLVTPNVDHVVSLRRDEQFRQAYELAAHQLCDSRILQPLVGWVTGRRPELITGSDLTAELMQSANQRGLAINVVGCEAQDIELLRQRYPSLRIQHHNPIMGFIQVEDKIADCIDFVCSNPAPLTFICVGAPRQELLARRIKAQGQAHGVGLCVGSALKFLSGRTRRAPRRMQEWRLEWLHRLLMDPRRLAKRYAYDALMLCPVLLDELRQRLRRRLH